MSRDEILGGMPARRASTVLYGIESRTARLILLNRQALTHVLNERSATIRERAFLEAVAGGRDLPERPAIQDLERFADAWAPLVPADPRVRAAVFHRLAERDPLPAGSVDGIRRALGVDEPAVAEAHEALYGAPISAALRTSLPPG